MASQPETDAMKKALKLSVRGRGNTFPNPMVGAVVLDSQGEEVGDGFHRKCGEPHAEVVALSSAGERAEGGTMVVSLEPCCHQGRTGPCTDRIIEAGISRVVIAMRDPDPRVCGGGVRQLESAGIDVETGILEDRAREINRVYLHYLETGRSWVTLKMAVTLDGRIAAEDGGSQWISCEESRRLVHRKRASVGGILTGAGTVRADDPQLTVRLAPLPPSGQPGRILVTSSGDLGGSENILKAPGTTILAVPEGMARRLSARDEMRKVEFWEFPPEEDGGIPLDRLLARAAEEGGMGEILCECGPVLATELLRKKLVDSVMIFTAPSFLGAEGLPALGQLGIASMDGIIRLKDVSYRKVGSDYLTEGRIVYGSD